MASWIRSGYLAISAAAILACVLVLGLACLALVTAVVDISASHELAGVIDVRSEFLAAVVKMSGATAMVGAAGFVVFTIVNGQSETTRRLAWLFLLIFSAALVTRPAWFGTFTLITSVQGLWVILTFWLLRTYPSTPTARRPDRANGYP